MVFTNRKGHTDMFITAIKLAFKASRSKTARKVARKAVKVARDNVTVDTAGRAITIDTAGRSYRIDRDTFRRPAPAVDPAKAEWDEFWS